MSKQVLSVIQYRLWADFEMSESKSIYNMYASAKISGKLSEEIFEKSLLYGLEENPLLHSCIEIDKEGNVTWNIKDDLSLPYQIIDEKPAMTDNEVNCLVEKYGTQPFDLRNEYPCRFYLIRFPNNEYLFIFVVNHIVMDAGSILNFSRRLSEIYNSELQMSYKAKPLISALQNYNKYDQELNASLNKDDGIQAISNYLLDTPMRAAIPNLNGEKSTVDYKYIFNIEESLRLNCKQFCRTGRTTLFRLFSGVWGITMCRLLVLNEIVIDHPINTKPTKFSELNGMFINNLPMAVHLSENTTGRDVLDEINKERKIITKYSSVDYALLIPKLREARRNSYETTPNIAIDYPIPHNLLEMQLEGCTTECLYYPLFQLIPDLTLAINDQLVCTLRVKKTIPAYFAKEIADAFINLLTQIIEDPDKKVLDLPLIYKEKETNILLTNRVQKNVQGDSPVRELVFNMEQFGDKVALVCQNKQLTYAELNTLTERMAFQIQRYLHSHGINNKHVCIGVGMLRNIYTLPAIIAILRAGHTYVPIDATLPRNRMDYIVKDADIQLIISERNVANSFTCKHILLIEELLVTAPCKEISITPDLAHTAYIIYTSGTTGKPKGTPISGKALGQMVLNLTGHAQWVKKEDVTLQMASVNFDASVADIFPSLYVGATLVMADDAERKDINLLVSLIETQRISFAIIPPVVLAVMPIHDYPSLKTMVLAGEATSMSVFERWMKQGRRIINAYGPTENAVCTTFCEIDNHSSATDIGLPLNNVSCYVLDERQHLLPYGVEGELYIGGEQLTEGYLNQPEQNHNKFVLNPFVTKEEQEAGVNTCLYKSGDKVCLMPNGHIEYKGRTDFQLKINGYRIELEEIEAHIKAVDGVEQAAVVAIPDEAGHFSLAAYVQINAQLITLSDLQNCLSEQVPSYMIPANWTLMTQFPIMLSGKIDRKCLPKPQTAIVEHYVAPTTASEAIVSDILAHILNQDKIGIETDLFNIGITSLQLMSAVYEAENKGVRVQVSAFYKYRTIRKTLMNSKSYSYYWYNEYQEDKPVLIVVCGFPYFAPVYHYMGDIMSEKYSLLVFESFTEDLYHKKECTLEFLLSYYMSVLPGLLKGKNVFGVTGLCLGGEMALQLAVELWNANVAQPIVFSLDGYVVRNKHVPDSMFVDNEPNIDDAIKIERNRIFRTFVTSMFFRPYKGIVYSCLARDYNTEAPFQTMTEEDIRQSHITFEENPSNWKRLQPNCKVCYLSGSHFDILRPECLHETLALMEAERLKQVES